MQAQTDLIFYDGHCGLSHHAVTFLLQLDTRRVFRFAPIQGEMFRLRTTAAARSTLPDSMVVQTQAGDLLTGPLAWIYILRKIGGIWRLIAALMKAVPSPLSQLIYKFVARTRYCFFGRRATLYPKVAAQLQSRFDT